MQLSHKKLNTGFSLVELLVVAAIFATAVGAFFGAATISFRAVSKASDKIQAAFLMEEGLEGVRYMRDAGWTHYLTAGTVGSASAEELGYERCLYFDRSNNMFATSTGSIVSQWHLDDASGASSIIDSSTTTNTGTPTSVGLGSSYPGVNINNITNYRTAASFNGASSYIMTTKTPAQLGLTNTVTLEAWVKINAGSGIRRIVGAAHDGGFCCPGAWDASLLLDTNSKPQFNMTVVDATWTSTVTAANAIDTNWHHIVGTYENTGGNNGVMKLYVDGQLTGTPLSGTRLPVWSGFPFYIGARHVQAGQVEFFNGKIDEVTIYNRALSASEVKDRYSGHATCRPSALTDDNSSTFARTVSVVNTCRNVSNGNIVDVSTSTVSGAACHGGTVDTSTKKATVNILWGDPNQRFIEKAEMYIANLFLN